MSFAGVDSERLMRIVLVFAALFVFMVFFYALSNYIDDIRRSREEAEKSKEEAEGSEDSKAWSVDQGFLALSMPFALNTYNVSMYIRVSFHVF